MSGFIIAGTDTDVGKTVVAAMLVQALDGYYWKPVQSGLENDGDRATVQKLTGLPTERFFPEMYVFTQALSPHRASELDGAEVDVSALAPPACRGPLLIEPAGGLLVPLTRAVLQVDVFKSWARPVILVARTGLGTINHTLLSLEALRARKLPVHGIIFTGDDNPDTIRTIAEFSGVRVLGRLPRLTELNAANLQKAFQDHFDRRDFSLAEAA